MANLLMFQIFENLIQIPKPITILWKNCRIGYWRYWQKKQHYFFFFRHIQWQLPLEKIVKNLLLFLSTIWVNLNFLRVYTQPPNQYQHLMSKAYIMSLLTQMTFQFITLITFLTQILYSHFYTVYKKQIQNHFGSANITYLIFCLTPKGILPGSNKFGAFKMPCPLKMFIKSFWVRQTFFYSHSEFGP